MQPLNIRLLQWVIRSIRYDTPWDRPKHFPAIQPFSSTIILVSSTYVSSSMSRCRSSVPHR
jgi:hypothetical protein